MRWRFIGIGAVVALALLLPACSGNQVPLSQLSAEQLWQQGANAYAAKDWDEAIRYFDRFVLTGGSDPRVLQARYYLGQAHFKRKRYVTAASEFSRLAADLGRTALADDARYMACRSYEELSPNPQLDQEYTQAALDHCRALIDYFPDSEFADSAQAVVDEMRGKLAEKLYEAGDWYYKRRAYDSSLIYFEAVVKQYPDTSWAPKALLREYQAYGILEYAQERTEVRDRLLREYPDSEAARTVSGG